MVRIHLSEPNENLGCDMSKGSYLELRKTDSPPQVPVLSLSLLEMLAPKRIAELAAECEGFVSSSGSRSADRMIIENIIRKALMEAVVNITNNV